MTHTTQHNAATLHAALMAGHPHTHGHPSHHPHTHSTRSMSSYNHPRTIGILELIKANAKTGIYTHQIATQLNVTPKQARESIRTLKRQGHIEGYGDTGAGRARAWVPKGAKLDMLATYTKPGTTAAMHLHRAANRAAAEAAGTTGARLTTPCNGPGYTPPKPLHTGNTGSATASTTASDGRTAAQWPTPSQFLNEGTSDQYKARKGRTQATVNAITDA